MEKIWLFLIFFVGVHSMDNLKVVYQWNEIDFNFPSEQERIDAKASGQYIPENNLPLGLEVYDNRLFITVPRWRSGVAASLTYINLSGSTQNNFNVFLVLLIFLLCCRT